MSDPNDLDARDYRDILRRNGFEPCDIPVCNCGSWHPRGGFYARFKEIEEAVEDATGGLIQGTLLDTVKKLARDAERWRAIAPLLRTNHAIPGSVVTWISLDECVDGKDLTVEQVVDRLVKAEKKP